MYSEAEWASFGSNFLPLRVSEITRETREGEEKQRDDEEKNEGSNEQYAYYRLQIPYRWSVPLMLLSILLHWLFSQSFYVVSFSGKSIS